MYLWFRYLHSFNLQMGVEFRMRVTPETQDMSASVNSLQIASAIFNEREKRRAQVWKLQCRFLDLCESKILWFQSFASNCELISSCLTHFISGFVDPESLWYLLLQQDATREIPPHGHLDIWSHTQHLSPNNKDHHSHYSESIQTGSKL